MAKMRGKKRAKKRRDRERFAQNSESLGEAKGGGGGGGGGEGFENEEREEAEGWGQRGLEEARNSRVLKYSRERERESGKRWTEGERRWKARFRSSSKAGKDLPLLPSRSLALAETSQDASAKLQTSVKCLLVAVPSAS